MAAKYKSSTMWLSFFAMLIIAMIVGLKLSWAVGIGMALVAIPTVYVTGNKLITVTAVKKGVPEEDK